MLIFLKLFLQVKRDCFNKAHSGSKRDRCLELWHPEFMESWKDPVLTSKCSCTLFPSIHTALRMAEKVLLL